MEMKQNQTFFNETYSNLIALFSIGLEIKHKTRHFQRGNWIHKMYKEKFVKIVKLQMRKNKSTGQKVLKQFFNVLSF